MSAITIILIALLLIFVYVISVYNKLIGMIESAQNNKKQIDIQLDRRYKVFESLINVVKKYMDYEQTTLKDVVALRNQAQSAVASGNEKARIDAENQISKIASGINVVFERYPELKADKNAMQFQEEIVNTENKLSFAKQAFNDSVERYNATKKSFVESFIVSFYDGKLNVQFTYWGLADEAAIKQREDYTVQM